MALGGLHRLTCGLLSQSTKWGVAVMTYPLLSDLYSPLWVQRCLFLLFIYMVVRLICWHACFELSDSTLHLAQVTDNSLTFISLSLSFPFFLSLFPSFSRPLSMCVCVCVCVLQNSSTPLCTYSLTTAIISLSPFIFVEQAFQFFWLLVYFFSKHL